MANKSNDMAHRKWMCKYHIVFIPKYRRKLIYNQYKESIRDILKQLCSYKGVEIIEGHLMPDHIHMLVSIPPKMSVSSWRIVYVFGLAEWFMQTYGDWNCKHHAFAIPEKAAAGIVLQVNKQAKDITLQS